MPDSSHPAFDGGFMRSSELISISDIAVEMNKDKVLANRVGMFRLNEKRPDGAYLERQFSNGGDYLRYVYWALRVLSARLFRGIDESPRAAIRAKETIELIVKKERATLSFDVNGIEWNTPMLPFNSSVSNVQYKILFFAYTPAYILRCLQ
jgi:hypothetical protein